MYCGLYLCINHELQAFLFFLVCKYWVLWWCQAVVLRWNTRNLNDKDIFPLWPTEISEYLKRTYPISRTESNDSYYVLYVAFANHLIWFRKKIELHMYHLMFTKNNRILLPIVKYNIRIYYYLLRRRLPDASYNRTLPWTQW